MREIQSAPIEELYDDLEFAQKAKISYEQKLIELQKQMSSARIGIRGAQAMIDDATAEIERRSIADD